MAQAGVVPGPAPGLVVGTLLHTRAEALPLATALLHAIWLVSALPREDHRLSTTAHHRATIGKRPHDFKSTSNRFKPHVSLKSHLFILFFIFQFTFRN